MGAALVGTLAFALRGALNINAVSAYMEVAVGVSIMVIGDSGFKEAREWRTEAAQVTESAGGELMQDTKQSLSAPQID